MIITGTTEHKLDQIKSYKKSTPYIVGVKGVTNVITDSNGVVTRVQYTIDGIHYDSDLTNPTIPTTYSTDDFISGSEYFDNTKYFFKEELKMNQIFEPKIDERIFIERQQQSVMELHSRLSEITSIGMLEDYKNGFYKINKLI